MIVGSIIKGALRKLGALATGTDVQASELEEALTVVRQMYLEFVGSGLFGRQCDIAVAQAASDFTAYPGSRFVTEDLASINITLPEFVTDTWWRYDYGARWQPPQINTYGAPYNNVRPPLDGSLVTLADLSSDQTRTYVYDAALARWTDLQALAVTDVAPLSTRYGEGLTCELAIRLAPEYTDGPIAQSVIRGAAQGRSALAHRFDGPERVVRGQFF